MLFAAVIYLQTLVHQKLNFACNFITDAPIRKTLMIVGSPHLAWRKSHFTILFSSQIWVCWVHDFCFLYDTLIPLYVILCVQYVQIVRYVQYVQYVLYSMYNMLRSYGMYNMYNTAQYV